MLEKSRKGVICLMQKKTSLNDKKQIYKNTDKL